MSPAAAAARKHAASSLNSTVSGKEGIGEVHAAAQVQFFMDTVEGSTVIFIRCCRTLSILEVVRMR